MAGRIVAVTEGGMVSIDPRALPLSPDEKQRLSVLLETVSSHTLLKVLRDMEGENADARLIVEVLLERMPAAGGALEPHDPVMPK